MRSYWVVSPNVKSNRRTVPAWRQASVLGRAAFMGWGPDRKPIGYRFAHEIKPGDVILIARRHGGGPEIVGFGVVQGKYKRRIKGVSTPSLPGSMRKLGPFIAISAAPKRIRLIDVLTHSAALAKLHPTRAGARYKVHAEVCNWMDRLLAKVGEPESGEKVSPKEKSKKGAGVQEAHIAAPQRNYQLDYIVRSKKQIREAKKNEAGLLISYRRWLKRQGRTLAPTRYGKLECDGYERERRNLIEAKSSTSREHIRMAVGQLLDYGFHMKRTFGLSNMAILLPKKPDPRSVDWLTEWKISLIWRERGSFLDDANGRFA